MSVSYTHLDVYKRQVATYLIIDITDTFPDALQYKIHSNYTFILETFDMYK